MGRFVSLDQLENFVRGRPRATAVLSFNYATIIKRILNNLIHPSNMDVAMASLVLLRTPRFKVRQGINILLDTCREGSQDEITEKLLPWTQLVFAINLARAVNCLAAHYMSKSRGKTQTADKWWLLFGRVYYQQLSKNLRGQGQKKARAESACRVLANAF